MTAKPRLLDLFCGAGGAAMGYHRDGIEWDMILDYIYRHILVDPSKLETVCPKCHETLTACDKAERAGL